MKALLDLLRSMRFAIAILTVVAVAASIGSVLQQSQPAVVYVSSYGEFWAAFFSLCGLTDVYHAWWFYALLVFMASSTALCLWQNTPSMLRAMRNYRENKSLASLRNLECHAELALSAHPAALSDYLRQQGFRHKQVNTAGGTLLAARAGSARRLGYLFVHGAMVLICVGGLIDGTISYRASMTIAEGASSDTGLLQNGDTIVEQKLPFSVRLKSFRIDHYPNGQPMDFSSEIDIVDNDGVTPATLQVNHPYTHRGVTLFQSGFADGGSQVTLRLQGAAPQDIKGVIGDSAPLLLNGQPATLEFTELRAINVFDKEGSGAGGWHSRGMPGERTRDIGPSLAFRLRDQQGQADTWLLYQQAIKIDGAYYRVLGHQAGGQEAMDYLRIPLDADDGIDGYLRLAAALSDPEQRAMAAQQVAAKVADPRLAATLSATSSALLEAFQHAGYRALSELSAQRDDHEQARKTGQLYQELLERSASLLAPELSPRQLHDALTAYDDTLTMKLPALFTFERFKQVNATGLQVTHAPGAKLVYLGCALLALGVCAMYFIRERRLWLHAADGKLLLALSANRNTPALKAEFERHAAAIGQLAGSVTP